MLLFETCLQDELASFIRRILEEAKEKWSKGEEPTREDGCFVSPVAYDIIQVKTVLRGKRPMNDLHRGEVGKPQQHVGCR